MSSSLHPEPGAAAAVSPRRVFRNMLQGSGFYSIALLAAPLASLIVLPINTRFLTPADYGTLDLLQQVTIVVSLLAGMNLSGSLGFFLAERTLPAERATVLGTAFFGSLGVGCVVAFAGFFFAPAVSKLVFATTGDAAYLRLVFLSVPLTFVLEVCSSWMRVEDRSGAYLGAALLRIGVSVAGTIIGLAVLHMGVWGVLSASIAAMIATGLPLAVYAFRIYPPAFEFPLLLRLAKFAFPLGLSGVALFVVHFGDRFLLPHYRPMSDLGVYSVAYKIGMLISLVYFSFHSYWSAQVYQIARRDDAPVIIARTFSYLMLVLTLCGMALVVGSHPALRILTRPAYAGAAPLVPIIVLAYYIRGIGDFFRCLFLVQGRPGYDAACNWIGSAACIVAYFALIPRWGIWGAAIATLIAFILIGFLSVFWSYRVHPYKLETARLAKLAVAAGVPMAAYFMVPVSSLTAQIGWAAGLMLLCLFLLTILRFQTSGEWEVLRSIPGRLRAAGLGLGGAPLKGASGN
ncbi:MAG TPA: oligosaccharide flippase family protein [Bryobacteraceae bacterium]|nr:oligosaccharide flippase family protein [Bryobacteraceae bacterium]